MRITAQRHFWLNTLLVVWLAGLVLGGRALWVYSVTPGKADLTPAQWPEQAPIVRKPGQATLVLLAHPHCPCTRASLAELAKLVEHNEADTWILFLRPEGAQPGWEKTSLWETAAAIPGVHVLADTDGTAAHVFGAETSGHVLLYDPAGRLQFSGGITAARGHEGPSAGGASVLAALHGAAIPQHQAQIFGCPLQCQETTQ